ncbi:unnamed protein product [Meloidogyne enterolobii]|uniref:Uncharacterized protein n=1 Tax=Meloidogyne enterolobii TaxID=390850 RepID=A0ACB0XNU5_MELEN
MGSDYFRFLVVFFWTRELCYIIFTSKNYFTKKIPLFFSYVIGNIIGSGIFIAPSTIIRHTESAGLSLLVWVIGALIAFLGSLCYIELGTSIREAGCDFAYICYVKWLVIKT